MTTEAQKTQRNTESSKWRHYSSNDSFKNDILLGASFVILATLFCHLAFSWMGFTPTDEGFTLAYSRRLLDGQIPHRDFIIIRPFLSPLLHVPFVFFGGQYTFWLSRAFVWFEFACISWCWTLVLNRFLALRLSTSQKLLAAVVCFSAIVHTKHLTAWHTIDGLWFTAVALLLCIHRRTRFAGYFLLGLAPLCKQNFLFVIPLFLVVLGDWRQLKYWLAAVMPGVLYLSYVTSHHAFSAALSQLASHTELLQAGVLAYLNRHFAVSLLFGVTSACLIKGGLLSDVTKRRFGFIVFYCVPLTVTGVSLWFGNMASDSFLLFGMLVGIAGYLFVNHDGSDSWKRFALLVIIMGWTASLSGGYNVPALMSGPMLLALISWPDLVRPPIVRFHRSFMVAALLITISFAVARARFIYRDQSASRLHEPVGSVVPGAKLIYTNENTFEFLADLNRARLLAEVRHERYAILPDVAAFWVKTAEQNPLPAVWPQKDELSTPDLMDQFIQAMEARRNDTIFIIQKERATELAQGFVPLPNDDYYGVVRYARTHFTKVDETKHFELYK